jgi:transposase
MTDHTTLTFLSDAQWLLIQPLFPPSTRGRPALDTRLILENIFWKLLTRQPWYAIPSASPSWQVCYQRLHRWQHTGLWKSILKILILDLRDRGGFDLLKLWNGGHLSIQPDASGKIEVVCPPEFKGSWQISTALLLLMALSNGFLPKHKTPRPY